MNGPQHGIRAAAAISGEGPRALILIVEDDDIQAGILTAVLERAGFGVDATASGLNALPKMRKTIYDVVLIDYQLADIDGIATVRLIRDFMGPAARPVLIAVTVTPEVLNARTNDNESLFDLVAGKSGGLSPVLAFIRHRLSLAADVAARREAASALLEQARLEYFSGPRRPEAAGDNPVPARILIVEDDESQRLLLESVVRARGYSVETASNGLEAVHKIRNERFDLALVDYIIPEIDGLAVAKLTHHLMADTIRPRLIALTMRPEALHDAEGYADIMFDKIIEKSSGFDELMRIVDSLMKLSPNLATRRAAEFSTRTVNSGR